jgi:hypothetical protein
MSTMGTLQLKQCLHLCATVSIIFPLTLKKNQSGLQEQMKLNTTKIESPY